MSLPRRQQRHQQAMSVFSVGGNAGFAIEPLFVAAVLAPRHPSTPILAVPALITGVAVYGALRRSGSRGRARCNLHCPAGAFEAPFRCPPFGDPDRASRHVWL
jgi:hypothetical protein